MWHEYWPPRIHVRWPWLTFAKAKTCPTWSMYQGIWAAKMCLRRVVQAVTQYRPYGYYLIEADIYTQTNPLKDQQAITTHGMSWPMCVQLNVPMWHKIVLLLQFRLKRWVLTLTNYQTPYGVHWNPMSYSLTGLNPVCSAQLAHWHVLLYWVTVWPTWLRYILAGHVSWYMD